MKIRPIHHALLLTTILAPLTAAAQGTSPRTAPNVDQIADIIVTAQRVQENLQRTPIAVTAYGEEQLKRSSIESFGDLAIRTPGFTFSQSNANEPILAMRGIGSALGISQNAGGDPSVVIFVDGIYAGRGGTPDIDSLDLERVEVLRGPQGTLFGKNAIGGIVNFVSKKPGPEDRVRIDAGVGTYKRLEGGIRGNVALNERIFFAGGISIKDRDGFFLNEPTGNRNPSLNLLNGRGALRFLPSDNLDITLSVDATHQDQRAQPRDNKCNINFNGGIHCVGINPDPRITNAEIDGFVKRDLRIYRGEIVWSSGIGELTSLTAYRTSKLQMETPFFSNPINPPTQVESTQKDRENNNQFSQELRLAIGSADDDLTGQVGVYFLREHNKRTQFIDQQLPVIPRIGTVSYPQDVVAKSYAVFGQFNYNLFAGLTATAGARMTWEKKDVHLQGYSVAGAFNPIPLNVPYNIRSSENWKAFTPRIALNWQATDDALAYVSATKGYKSGGYQGIAGDGMSASTPYNPEYAWSYEAGIKTRWLSDRLQLNAAAFQTDYKDLQISQLVPFIGVVVGNAASARIRGLEFEFVMRPVRGLQIDGNYTWLDAKFKNFATGATADYTGNYLPRSPKRKFNLGLQYDAPIADWTLRTRADFSDQAHYFFEASNIPAQRQDGYVNIDARVSLLSPGDVWSLSLWGKNLTNELVKTYVTGFAAFQQELVPYAPPRTLGATVTVNF